MNTTHDRQRVDLGFFTTINGSPQWLALRGTDRRNPPLLVIGGPGIGFAALAPFFEPWERRFTLVLWDPPGAGFTFAKNGQPASLTVDALVEDGLCAARVAAAELGFDRVTLFCISAGTMVGLQMIQRAPALFSAYVGSGQIVDWSCQDRLSYERLLARARERADEPMAAELAEIGPPPYADTATDARKSRFAAAPTEREAAAFVDFGSSVAAAMQGLPEGAAYLAPGLTWPEPRARSMAIYDQLRRHIVGFDARRLSRRFELPLFFFQGAEDVFTVTSEVARYAEELDAPRVELVIIPAAGHSAAFLREDVLALLTRYVLPVLPSRE